MSTGFKVEIVTSCSIVRRRSVRLSYARKTKTYQRMKTWNLRHRSQFQVQDWRCREWCLPEDSGSYAFQHEGPAMVVIFPQNYWGVRYYISSISSWTFEILRVSSNNGCEWCGYIMDSKSKRYLESNQKIWRSLTWFVSIAPRESCPGSPSTYLLESTK